MMAELERSMKMKKALYIAGILVGIIFVFLLGFFWGFKLDMTKRMSIVMDLGHYPSILDSIENKEYDNLKKEVYQKMILDLMRAESGYEGAEDVSKSDFLHIFNSIANHMALNPYKLNDDFFDDYMSEFKDRHISLKLKSNMSLHSNGESAGAPSP